MFKQTKILLPIFSMFLITACNEGVRQGSGSQEELLFVYEDRLHQHLNQAEFLGKSILNTENQTIDLSDIGIKITYSGHEIAKNLLDQRNIILRLIDKEKLSVLDPRILREVDTLVLLISKSETYLNYVSGRSDLAKLRSEMEKLAADIGREINGLKLRDDQLSASITALNTDLNAKIALLGARHSELATFYTRLAALQVNDKAAAETASRVLNETLQAAVAELHSRVDLGNEAMNKVKSDLSAEITSKIAELRNLDASARMALDSALRAELNSLTQQSASDRNQFLSDISRLGGEIRSVHSDLENFRVEVQKTYATKSQLEQLESRVRGLDDLLEAIKADFSNDRAAVQASLRNIATEHASLKLAIEERIVRLENNQKSILDRVSKVEGNVSSLQSDLSGAIDEFKSIERKLRDELLDRLAALDRKISASNDAEANARSAFMAEIEAAIIEHKGFTDAVRGAMESKIQALSAAHGQEFDALAKALREAGDSIKLIERDGAFFQQSLASQVSQLYDMVIENREFIKANQALASSALLMAKSVDNSLKDLNNRFDLSQAQIEQIRLSVSSLETQLRAEIADVAEKSRELVSALGADVQAQMAKVSADVLRMQAETGSVKSRLIASVRAQEGVSVSISNADLNRVQQSIGRSLISSNKLHRSIVQAIAPIQEVASVNQDKFNNSFKAIMAECAETNTSASFAHVGGIDYFSFLAREATNQVALRENFEDFLRTAKPAGDNSDINPVAISASMSVLKVLSSQESCESKIGNWARGLLVGTDALAIELRARMNENWNDAELSPAIASYKADLKALDLEIKTFSASLESQVQLARSAAGLVRSADFAKVQPELVAILQDGAARQVELAARMDIFGQLADAQQTLSTGGADQQEELQALRTEMMAAFEDSKVKSEARLGALESSVRGLSQQMQSAMMLIATLAARTGHQDLKAMASGVLAEINGSQVEFQPKVARVQHFFADPAQKNQSDTCSGATLDAVGVVAYGNCWVNFRSVAASVALGSVDTFRLRVFGAATHLEITGYGEVLNVDLSDPNVTLQRVGPLSGGVFDVKIGQFVKRLVDTYNKNRSQVLASLYVVPIRKTATATVRGPAVTYNVQLYSPIVLNVSGQRLKTLSSGESRVAFDLDNSGLKKSVGWLPAQNSQQAFLAMDLNGDGRIDTGAELFGQATRLPNGSTARDGYEALRQHDLDESGWIDSKDPIFNKLIVWRDLNANGISEKNELSTLKEFGITEIEVQPKAVAAKDLWNNGNAVPLEAQLRGPACSSNVEACKSYDVFFEMAQTIQVSSAQK